MNEQTDKMIVITKVVSRDIISDAICWAQNLFGANLNRYEQMIQRGTKQCEKQLNDEQTKLKSKE